MDDFKEISLVSSSRGLRNIALCGGGRYRPSVDSVVAVATSLRMRGFRDCFYAWSRDHFIYIHGFIFITKNRKLVQQPLKYG